MHANFGSRFDHLSDEMFQMNNRICRIAHRQYCLGGFAPLPSLKHVEESSSSKGGDDDSFGSEHDDKMTISQ